VKNVVPLRVRVGGFALDVRAGELHKNGRIIRLQQKPCRVLHLLVEHGGQVVTRDEIQKRLWPNDTVVDFEHGINSAIKKLRAAFGDSAESPKYIETLARRGYRLVAAVEWITAAEDSPSNPMIEVESLGPTAIALQPDSGSPIGRGVSHYRVLEVIGGGGMGMVYTAEDLKLGRRVALKFLPEELASDAIALQRFEREAQTASSLNHPNICTIYEFGEHEGQPFIVMELLEGDTLRDRLAAGEVLPMFEQLLEIGIQLSQGLAAAHERGIVHRDIKPANIFITNKGICKILDFGLVKLLESDDEEPAQRSLSALLLPTAAGASHPTRTGVTMGTAGYMSPEQVRGEKLDARTDLFSFGLVLYEIATGQRAFSGKTAAVVHDAILYQPQIPVHDLNSSVPSGLEAIIDKALEKNRDRRYQSAVEMEVELKRLRRDVEVAAQKKNRSARALLFWGMALAIVFLALGTEGHWFRDEQTSPGKTLSERQVTHNPAENRVSSAAISPDGKYLVYIDHKGLHSSAIGIGESRDIPIPEKLRIQLEEVAWFPDGKNLILTGDSDTEGHVIWVTSVLGGSPRKLRSFSWRPAPSPQGSLIAFVTSQNHEIWVMGAEGENPHRILTSESDTYSAVAWSPNGLRLAYIRAGRGPLGGSIETVSLDGGSPSVVISDPQLANEDPGGLVWASDGRVIFVSEEGYWHDGGNLWEIMTDPRTGNPSGKATKITDWDGVEFYSTTVSRDGKRLVVVKANARDDVYVGELKAGGMRLVSAQRLTASSSDDFPSAWMPDSKTLLISSNRTGRRQVFGQQMQQDTAALLIRGPGDETDAKPSPHGHWILYWSSALRGDLPATTARLMRLPASGGTPEQVLEALMDDATDFDCPIHAAASCVLSHWEQGELIFDRLDPVRGRGEELARTKLVSTKDLDWRVSPDGLRIALASRGQLPGQIRIVDLRNHTERNLRLPHQWGILSLGWSADGDALFAATVSTATGDFITRFELRGKARVILDREKNRSIGYPHPSPDGHRLAFSQATSENNAWLLEHF
jgi:serine/threonine protein kinase